ncbi:FAD linked oxidase [Gracilibacillus halophilus YIM-C55.5]|uniref:FAD linked oxidase n=1 Tax=Gracilibacillus halophilus YIM-C55.5 TaxID=1308866 RepID=N4W764_9BACI|nr:FAD-binding protein [Gracilibacillus halophilus]ENH96063.1 FAD linked oxidase [Gracilibacillus halophilus YIM-C55.5]
MSRYTNWAGNYTYQASNWYEPDTIQQVQEIVANCHKIRVVGSRHSFNGIADSTENILSLERLNQVIRFDHQQQTITVEGGMKYSDLSTYVDQKGFAIENLASLPHISVAGACATATHGSGDNNRNLSSSVRAMEVVNASGEMIHFSRDKHLEEMHAASVGLGAFGVITKVTLDLIPAFQMKQDVYDDLPLAQLEQHLDDIFSSAYSVSLFTDWKSETFNQVWLKDVCTDDKTMTLPDDFFGAKRARDSRHPIPGQGTENCTEQLGVPGPWYERLPHFRIDFTPSSGEELQSEYIVPRKYAYDALAAINTIRELIAPHLHISEIRSIAKDELWMSPCYQQDSIGLHFTWKKDWEAVQQVLPKVEEVLQPFHARPHWGKLFTMNPSHVQSLFVRLPDFKRFLLTYDPSGKFRNSFIDTYIFGK